MTNPTYEARREALQTYFDKTAVGKWKALTSNTPVSRIRETVRLGREAMRNTLVSWLPENLHGREIFDAGCGTGMLAIDLASRGAKVNAVDISPELIHEANKRATEQNLSTQIDFQAGDMMTAVAARFDHVIAMDSLIHYPLAAKIQMIETLAAKTNASLLFTFAPKTPALSAMKFVGKAFPRNDRSPAIEPVSEATLRRAIKDSGKLINDFSIGRTKRISTAFYKSQAMELIRR